MVTRTGGGTDEIIKRLEQIKNLQLNVGFFDQAKYPDGTSVAYVATIQEYGAEINHNGGTRYSKSANGKSKFVGNDFIGPVHGVTGAHKITIPPRPFVRPTMQEQKKAWAEQLRVGYGKVLEGKIEAETMLKAVGEGVRGDIRKKISQINTPSLAKSTLHIRKTRKVDPNDSSKPLIDTGLMLDSVDFIVTDGRK